MSRWFDLPIEDGEPSPRLFFGDVYRVRDQHGTIRLARLERPLGGGLAFYDETTDEPIDVHAVEVSR